MENLPTYLDERERKLIEDAAELLKIYEALHGVQARAPEQRYMDGVIWGREIALEGKTVGIAVTRESLAQEGFLVRVVSSRGQGVPPVQDAEVSGLLVLSQVLRRLFEGTKPPRRSSRPVFSPDEAN